MEQKSLANFVMQGALALAVVTIIALAVVLRDTQTRVARYELDSLAEDRMLQTVENQRLLHFLHDNQTDDLRQTLSLQVAANLGSLRDQPPSNSGMRGLVQKMTLRILHETKEHPEIYFAAAPVLRAAEMKAWLALDQPALLTQTSPIR
jgi:hypothetical protein